jgi:leader peptidase (prepilin peptidase)/N-methyltransferase
MILGRIVLFILGTIIGSFLNVVILRFNTGRGIDGRSGCMTCGKQLKALDMIPVLSWFILKGRCRNCKTKISIQYPLVEFFTGILFLLLFISIELLLMYPNLAILSLVWNAIIFSILIVIFVYDIYHKVIPNVLSYTFAGLGLVQTIILLPNEVPTITTSLDLFAGLIFFIPFFLLWYLSKGKWIGLGDGKLVLGIGWYLGFVSGLSAIMMAFWIGALYALFLMLIDHLERGKEKITMKTEIPFGPFLILAVWIQFFLNLDLFGISLFF